MNRNIFIGNTKKCLIISLIYSFVYIFFITGFNIGISGSKYYPRAGLMGAFFLFLFWYFFYYPKNEKPVLLSDIVFSTLLFCITGGFLWSYPENIILQFSLGVLNFVIVYLIFLVAKNIDDKCAS